MTTRQRIRLFALLAICCLAPLLQAQAQPLSPIEAEIERIQRATVFVYQVQDVGDDFFITCVGSGTLLSRTGLILTNAHTTSPSENCPGNTVIIALTINPDEPPVPLYRASILQTDPGLDLALLQLSQDIDGRQLDTESLALPFVEVADSSLVALDETIVVVGYGGLGDEPVAVVRGTVSSFTEEPTGEKSWMKTSATIPALMTGGGAYNSDGRLIGIPTTAPPGAASGRGECNVLQDTNADRLINDADICVPIGGFINALRSSNFARPLFRAASLGLSVDLDTAPVQATPLQGEPEISRLFFSAAVNDAALPSTIVSSLPTGSTSLYLFFDYANMTPETIIELRVTTNNIPNPTYSLAPVRWSGGVNGLWYIGTSNQVWENGAYDFTVFVDGIAKSTASITIGGAATEDPTLSDIVFGLSDIDGTPLGNGFVLPTGNIASARFIYRNMTEGMQLTERWFYENAEVYRNTENWSTATFDTDGARTISIQDAVGLLPGRYRLELYLDGRLSATSDFTLSGAAQGAFPEVFTDLHFASAPSALEAIDAPATNSFTTDVDTVYALFDWQNIERGTFWTVRWTVDNDTFYERTFRWNAVISGENFLIRLERPGGLPDGTYRVDLLVDRVQLATVEATVGIGQLPIDIFAQAGGLQLRGHILDVDTGQGIPGVTFVLISEDFSVADFVWDSEQIYALATTDRNGFFQLDRNLEISTDERSVPYSVVVNADGYVPVGADGFVVNAETPNPFEITIYLTKE